MSQGSLNEVSALTLEIAGLLRAQIALKQIKQNDIAKQARISKQQLSAMLNGLKRIDIEQLDRITQAIGIPLLKVIKQADENTASRRIESGIKPQF